MSNILCIDPSTTKLGYAIVPDGAKETQDIELARLIAQGSMFERIQAIVMKLESLIHQEAITEVFIEDTSYVPQISSEAKEALATLKTHIREALTKLGVVFHFVQPSSCRAAICKAMGVTREPGEKTWGKKHGLEAFRRAYGFEAMDDNVADAGNIAYCVMHNAEAFRKQPKVKARQKKLAV